MPLNPTPTGGLADPLRRLRNNSKQAQRVELFVAAGDELAESEDIAGQLEAASSAFQDTATATPWPAELVVGTSGDARPATDQADEAPAPAPEAPDTADEAEAATEAPKKPARRRRS